MWPIALALIGFAWARFQWITSLQARLFTVLTGSASGHRILAAASRQIFSSGAFKTHFSLVIATWALSTLVLGAISLAWVLGMVVYRSYRRLTRASKKRLNPTSAASEAFAVTLEKLSEPLPPFVNSECLAVTEEVLSTSEVATDIHDSILAQDDALVPFANLPVNTRHASLPDYDSLDSISSVDPISGQTHTGVTLHERDYDGTANPTMSEGDLFDAVFSRSFITNETRAKANMLISKVSSIKHRLIERVTLEIASTDADFSVGPATRNQICKDLRNKLCRSEIHLSRVITFIIQEAMGYSEYSLGRANHESFLCMSVDEMEHYCASIITGPAVWEVPPAPSSTRATTPTPEDESQSFIADDSVLHAAFVQPSYADMSTAGISSPCRNTLIFSASEEENLQDLLTDLKRLPPGSPSPVPKRTSSKYTDEETKTLATLDRFMSRLYSDARPRSEQTSPDMKGKFVPYEPLSPISPFLGGLDAANQSFSTSTPRGPKSMSAANAADTAMDTSMIMDRSAILNTTMIMDTAIIMDDSSLDTIRLGASASASADAGTGAAASTTASASANITRRWSAKIKDKGKAVQEPNTPPHTPLGVVNGILRARAAQAERRQQRKEETRKRVRKEQADTAAALFAAAAADISAYSKRGHARTGSSAVEKA